MSSRPELRVATERVLNAEAEKGKCALWRGLNHSIKLSWHRRGRWSDLQTLPAEQATMGTRK